MENIQQKPREVYLDWLRILAIAGVLLFHSAMPFVAEWEWHIKNRETSNILLEFNFFLSRFRMPLLFFISGAVVYIMMQTRTTSQFIGLRFRRLFIPLLFGMLVIVPLQVYMERSNQGFKGNFFEFYPTIFSTGAYPEGNLSWHHLWFIAYLFVFDVVLAPLFKWISINKHRLILIEKMFHGRNIYFLMIPSVVLFAALSMKFPETNDLINDWGYIIYWLFFLLAGFIAMVFPSIMTSLEDNRRMSLTLAFICIMAINYCRWNDFEPDSVFADYRNRWQTYAFLALLAANAWLWLFTAIGYGKHYLNKKIKALDYLNNAVYPFYILHQTVIVVVVYYVVQTADEVSFKYIFTVLVSLGASILIYHLFVRPYAIMRFLLGAKTQKAKDVYEPVNEKKPAVSDLAVV